MARPTSDTPGDERRRHTSASSDTGAATDPDGEFSVDRWTVQGHEALVVRRPDRVSVEWRPTHPRYFGVGVGDRLKDADADVSSPRIDEWEVTEITPDLVVGEHVGTGTRREFDRQRVERGLVVGNYATNLSDFARVVVHPVGSWETYDADADTDADAAGVVYRGTPYLTVVAHGNNGETYGLRYRYTDAGDPDSVTLWEEDVSVGGLDASLRTRLTTAVEAALTAEGYTVTKA
jgi:hypothetical protein